MIPSKTEALHIKVGIKPCGAVPRDGGFQPAIYRAEISILNFFRLISAENLADWRVHPTRQAGPVKLILRQRLPPSANVRI